MIKIKKEYYLISPQKTDLGFDSKWTTDLNDATKYSDSQAKAIARQLKRRKFKDVTVIKCAE